MKTSFLLGVVGVFFSQTANARTVSVVPAPVAVLPNLKILESGPGWSVPPADSIHTSRALIAQPTFPPDLEITGRPGDRFSRFGTAYLGVVAVGGAVNDIERVGFTLENGAEVFVSTPELNPVSGIPDYWVRVNVGTMRPGMQTLKINIYPNNPTYGVRTLVRKIFFNPNEVVRKEERWVSPAGSTNLAVCGSAVLPCDFLTGIRSALALSVFGPSTVAINLLPGNYSVPSVNPAPTGVQPAWMTIRAAPGVARSSVQIVSADVNGLGIKKVLYQGVTLRTALFGRFTGLYSDEVWVDDSDIIGNGQSAPSFSANGWATNFTQVVLTRSSVQDERGCAFLADYTKRAFISDVLCLRNRLGLMNIRSGLAYNVTIRQLGPGTTTDHPDAIGATLGGPIENMIYQNIRIEESHAQLLFLKETDVLNLAVLGVVATQALDSVGSTPLVAGPSPGGSAYGRIVNLVFAENTWLQPMNISITNPADFVQNTFRNNIFLRASIGGVSQAQIESTNLFENNHFINQEWVTSQNTATPPSGLMYGAPIPGALVLGTQATTGNAIFVNPASPQNLAGPFDWRLAAGSPANDRSISTFTGNTATMQMRYPSSVNRLFSIGAF